MSKERTAARIDAAIKIAERLNLSETMIDSALRETGLLCADLPALRMQANLASEAGHDVFTAVGAAYSALVLARGHLNAAHARSEALREQLRLPRMAAAPGLDKPDGNPQGFAAAVAA